MLQRGYKACKGCAEGHCCADRFAIVMHYPLASFEPLLILFWVGEENMTLKIPLVT